MQQRPVMYLDLDDTLISWAEGTPAGAPGVRDFLLWALDTFEVRWLTRWARTGEMEPGLLTDLAKMTGVPVERLARVQGLDWDAGDCKLDGIAWLEHTVMQRPFIWVEDETIGPGALAFLEHHGFADAHCCCNVTRESTAVEELHRQLLDRYATGEDAA